MKKTEFEKQWWRLRWGIVHVFASLCGITILWFASYYFLIKKEKVVEVMVDRPVIVREVLALPCEKTECFQFENISVSWDCVNSTDYMDGNESHFTIFTQNEKARFVLDLRLVQIVNFATSKKVEVRKDGARYLFSIERRSGDYNDKFEWYCNIDKELFEKKFKEAYFSELSKIRNIIQK
jgi:hypothetical protein